MASLGIIHTKLFIFPIALSELQNLLKLDLGYVQGTTLQFRKGMKIDKEAVKTYLVSHLGIKVFDFDFLPEVTLKLFQF